MHKFRRCVLLKTIRTKIISAMLLIEVLVSVSLTFALIFFFTSNNTESVGKSTALLAEQAAANFDSSIKKYVDELEKLVVSSSFASLETDKDRVDKMTLYYEENLCVESFGIYDNGGRLTAFNGSGCADIITEDDVKFAADRDKATITSVKVSENINYFAILVPIPSTDSISGGRLAAAVVDCTLIDESLANIANDTENDIYVAHEDGHVLFHNPDSLLLANQNPTISAKNDKNLAGLSTAFSSALDAQTGNCNYKYDDEKYTAGYYPSKYFNSVVIITTPTNSQLYTFGSNSVQMIVVFVCVMLIVTVVIAVVFSNKISKPIVSTTNRLRQLSNGDISTRVDVWYSRDELGVLSNSLEETIVSLRQYITLIQVALQQIAEGNLSHRMEGNFKGDFKKIKDTFNEIFESLTVTFDSINNSAEQVTSGAVMVSNSAQALSQGATQQASAIEELSATLGGVSDQVIQNSDNARNAYKIVHENTKAMIVCNEDMRNMLSAMRVISETSDEIVTILKVIDDISFQTNILALNAAVEAAREGSKGFGVVADEVRRLAARSTEAAKQTAELIKSSTSAVNNGTEIAEQTANSLDALATDSQKIKELIKNIADASAEQSEAIQQINTGVDQISAVISANTASAVASASASEELSSQSLILKNMIARFKLIDEKSKGDDDEDDESDENDGLDIEVEYNDERVEDIDDEDDKY